MRHLTIENMDALRRAFFEMDPYLFSTSYFGLKCSKCGRIESVEGNRLIKYLDNDKYVCDDCADEKIANHDIYKKKTCDDEQETDITDDELDIIDKTKEYSDFFSINDYDTIHAKIIESVASSNRYGITDAKVIDKNLIVSLTTTWNRITETPLAIETILNQQVMPNKIVLWLDKKYAGTELPKDIKRQIRRGLTVKYCEDVGPGTKLIPALKEFPDDVIITVDSDIFYDNTLIKDLIDSYKKDTTAIHAIRCRTVIAKNGVPEMYRKWKIIKNNPNESCSCFATGVGGVLYPPNTLHENVFDIDSLKECSFKQDDLWFYTMEMIRGTRVLNVRSTSKLGSNGYIENMTTFKEGGLCNENVQGGGNDISIKKLVEKYLKRTLDVCYVCNTTFKPWLEMSMRSIVYNNPFIKVNFHIITDERKFEAPKIKNTTVHVVDTSKIKRRDTIRRIDSNVKTSMCKFFIPKILSNCDRVLYVDCDTACCGPLYEILDMNIENKKIAVVEDYWLTRSKQYANSKSKTIAKNYFNSGVILYDIKLCQGTCEKLLEWNDKNEHTFMDQDALNAIFKESKKMINPKFNMMCRYYVDEFNVIDVEDRVKLPIIIHFAGTKKPNVGGKVKKEVYDFYKKMCD